MKPKALMTIPAIALACIMIFVGIPVSDSDNGRIDTNIMPSIGFTDREVIVFSEESFMSGVECALADSTSKIDNSVSKTPSPGSIVIIDEPWLTSTSNERLSANQIKEMIETNIPLIFVRGGSYLYEESGIELRMRMFSENNTSQGIFYGPSGITYAWGTNETDLDTVLPLAYDWAEEVAVKESERSKEAGARELLNRAGSVYWEPFGVSTGSFSYPQGKMNVSTSYSKLMNYDDGHTWYSVHYGQQGIPKTTTQAYRLADIYLKNTLGYGHYLLDTDPQSTSRSTTTIGVYLGSFAPVNWSYAASDVVIINTSNNGVNKINIWHDVNEKQNAGLGYKAEPGVLLRVSNVVNNGSLDITDNYGVQFGIKVSTFFGHRWDMYTNYDPVTVCYQN